LQAPPLATSNQTLIAIIAQQDIVNIERVIAVFSPADAIIFYNRSAQCETQLPGNVDRVTIEGSSEVRVLIYRATNSL
jgi:hypothetical protein